MANEEQLSILKQGVEIWNKWRKENPSVNIDLTEADLSNINLSNINLESANLFRANLFKANLIHAQLREASFWDADLTGANISESTLYKADLRRSKLNSANLSKTDLREANLRSAELWSADLNEANLTKADLIGASVVRASIEKAIISESRIWGINVWDLEGKFQEQKDLNIASPWDISAITVDNIKIAQFIYLILNNEEIRDVVNTLTSKTVLILGRFSISGRKSILDALRDNLRRYNLLPIVFDFDRPTDKDFTETIKTLAGLCYFVIADVTSPKSSPLELQAIVPDYQIPFVPIVQQDEKPFSMLTDLQKKYNWVLNTVSYDSEETLMKVLKPLIIDPAMNKRQELRIIKAQEPEIISAKDFLAKGKE